MAPAVEAPGAVMAQATLAGGWHLLTVAAPELARLAGPGQFAMVRCAAGWDPYLRRPLPFLRSAGDTVSFLFADGDPGLAWLAERDLGDPVSLLGPLGRGFTLDPSTRRLLLVAAAPPIAPLLALTDAALAAQASAALVVEGAVASDLASIIPPAVELTTAAEHAAIAVAAGMLAWADQAAVSAPVEALRPLAEAGRGRRPGFLQCYVPAPMACGLGWCGSCLTETAHGPRRACVAGPVFDLTELT